MAFKLGVQYDKPLALTVSHNSAKDQEGKILLITETFAILDRIFTLPYQGWNTFQIILNTQNKFES